MNRFWFIIIVCFPIELYFVIKAHYYLQHPEKFTSQDCFKLSHQIITILKTVGRIKTEVSGIENVPTDKTFLLASNHQGKYDAIGIVDKLPVPCGIIMDYERSKLPIVNEFIEIGGGKRLKRGDFRQQIQVFNEITEDSKKTITISLFFRKVNIQTTKMNFRLSIQVLSVCSEIQEPVSFLLQFTIPTNLSTKEV